MFYLTEDLVSSVKRRSLMPDGQKTYQDSDIVALANEEMSNALVPDIISIREDFFLQQETKPLVGLVAEYNISERAIGNSLKDVIYVQGTTKYPLSRVPSSVVSMMTASGTPTCYAVRGDKIVVAPKPNTSTGSLEIWHFARPNDLVDTALVTKITDVNESGSSVIFTVDTDQSSVLGTSSYVDFLNAQSPFMLWSQDVLITAINTSTITVDLADVADPGSVIMPGVGDYICPKLKSNIPMVPQEAHPILAQMVAARIVEGKGDSEKLSVVNSKLGEMRSKFLDLITPRVEKEAMAVVGRDSILNYSTRSSYGRAWR